MFCRMVMPPSSESKSEATKQQAISVLVCCACFPNLYFGSRMLLGSIGKLIPGYTSPYPEDNIIFSLAYVYLLLYISNCKWFFTRSSGTTIRQHAKLDISHITFNAAN